MSSAQSSASAKAVDEPKGSSPHESDPFLQPWQFFLLGGMLAATATVIVATGQRPENIIILSLTVVSVSFVGLGAYRMLLPLVTTDLEPPPTIGGRTRAALEREKTLVLRSIKELEFDHSMGKVSDADFAEMRDKLRARAVRLMTELEGSALYRAQIERDAAAISETKVKAPRACASCHTVNDADARFCKQCGAAL